MVDWIKFRFWDCGNKCNCVCVIPNVKENQLSSTIHIEFICQTFEEVGERGRKLLAVLTCSRGKEEHQDAVLQAHGDLTFCVQLILVLVVLHQNPVNKQVDHNED